MDLWSPIPKDVETFAEEATNTQGVAVIWDNDTSHLTVVLDDTAPASTVEERIRGLGISDVASIKHAEFRQTELIEFAATLVATGQVAWAAPTPDLSGVNVGVVDDGTSLGSARRGAASIPVTVVETEVDIEPASRDEDIMPYWAGADMKTVTSVTPDGYSFGGCTSAFAIWGATNNEMLTADHCSSPGDIWRVGRANTPMLSPVIGAFSRVAGANAPDIGVLSGHGAVYGPRMYHGPNSTANAVGIHGVHTAFVGSTVCYSGAPSGTVCGNLVTEINVNIAFDSRVEYGHGVRTRQTSNIPALGKGDSGGPVFHVNSAGQALAAGVISGMFNATTSCTGDAGVNGRVCSTLGIYAPVSNYLQAHPSKALMVQGSPYRDVPVGMAFATEMEWMRNARVLEDPTAAYIRPLEATTRGSMALFMYNMAGRPSATTFNCFADVQTNTLQNRAICWARNRGIAGGWPDNTFRPNLSVARDAMAAFLYRMAGSPNYSPPAVSPFTDVGTNNQFYKEINWLAARGISTGWADGSFRPLQPIARDAMSAFLYRMRAQNLA